MPPTQYDPCAKHNTAWHSTAQHSTLGEQPSCLQMEGNTCVSDAAASLFNSTPVKDQPLGNPGRSQSHHCTCPLGCERQQQQNDGQESSMRRGVEACFLSQTVGSLKGSKLVWLALIDERSVLLLHGGNGCP
jgi:hypothetical protein